VQRPLIVFTPKSMLRNKAAVSPLSDFTDSKFLSVIDDPTHPDPAGVTRVLLCSGKIYYELAAEQAKLGTRDTAVVRLEQYYPVPHRRLAEALRRYPNAHDLRWVQEEPANQGAWPFLGLTLPEMLPDLCGGLRRVSRRPMSAPASGSSKVHEIEQREVIASAFE
jgi:2-oxoglutarate decarboxylase